MQKLRVVLVTPKYPPVPSGYGNQAYSVNSILKEWASISLAMPGSHPVDIGIAHERAVRTPHKPKAYSLREIASWITHTCVWLIRNRRKYDIIHILGGYYWAVPFVLVGQLLGKPTIVKVVSEDVDLAFLDTHVRRLRIWFLRRAEVLVVLTEHTREAALRAGFKSAQVQKIPNGVDVSKYLNVTRSRKSLRDELGIPEDCFVVLFVGQVGRRKGVDRLLAVWRSFRRSASGSVRLVLVGAPDGSVPLDEIANAEDVHLAGHVNDPERFYGMADAFVLLSRSEGMANVLLEATAVGIPFVVSDIPPNRELASHLGGLVASGNDDQMISEATGHLSRLERAFRTQSPHSRNDNGQRLVLNEYSLVSVAERYRNLYRELLKV